MDRCWRGPAAQASFLMLAASFVALAWSFYVNDFSVQYVAAHSNAQLPTLFRFGAVWGGHEGSLLLWVFMLSGWTVAVAQFSRTLDDTMVARVIGVLGLVTAGLAAVHLVHLQPI
jgi:cytochrome c-type biogenesis protein CcmF